MSARTHPMTGKRRPYPDTFMPQQTRRWIDDSESCARVRPMRGQRAPYAANFEPSHRRVWIEGRGIQDEDAYPDVSDILNDVWAATLAEIDAKSDETPEEGEVPPEADQAGQAAPTPSDDVNNAETGPRDEDNTAASGDDNTAAEPTPVETEAGGEEAHEAAPAPPPAEEDKPSGDDGDEDDDSALALSSDGGSDKDSAFDTDKDSETARDENTKPDDNRQEGEDEGMRDDGIVSRKAPPAEETGDTEQEKGETGQEPGEQQEEAKPEPSPRPPPPRRQPTPPPAAVSEPESEDDGDVLDDQLVDFSDEEESPELEDDPDIDPAVQARMDAEAEFEDFLNNDEIVVSMTKEIKHKHNTKQWLLAIPAYEKKVARLQALAKSSALPKYLLFGDYTRLIDLYNEASTHLLEADQFEDALLCLKKAGVLTDRDHGPLMVRPGDADRLRSTTMNNFGVYYRRKGNLHSARNVLETALGLLPPPTKDDPFELFESRASSHVNMATTLSQLGKHQAAFEHARIAIRLLETNRSEKLSAEDTVNMTASATGVQLLSVAYYTRGVEQEFLELYSDSIVSYTRALHLTTEYLPDGHPLAKRFEDARKAAIDATEKHSKVHKEKKSHGMRIAPPKGTLEHEIEFGTKGPKDSPRPIRSPYHTTGANFFKDTTSSQILGRNSMLRRAQREKASAADGPRGKNSSHAATTGMIGDSPSHRPQTTAGLQGGGAGRRAQSTLPASSPRSRTAPPVLPRVRTANASGVRPQRNGRKSVAAIYGSGGGGPPATAGGRRSSRGSRRSSDESPYSNNGRSRPVTAPAPKTEQDGMGRTRGPPPRPRNAKTASARRPRIPRAPPRSSRPYPRSARSARASASARSSRREPMSSSSESDEEEHLLYHPPADSENDGQQMLNAYQQFRRLTQSGMLTSMSASFANLDDAEGHGKTSKSHGLSRTSTASSHRPASVRFSSTTPRGDGRGKGKGKGRGRKRGGRKKKRQQQQQQQEQEEMSYIDDLDDDDDMLYGLGEGGAVGPGPAQQHGSTGSLGSQQRQQQQRKRGPVPPPLAAGERSRPERHLQPASYHEGLQPFNFQVYHHNKAISPAMDVSDEWILMVHPEKGYAKGELLLPVQSPYHLEIVVRKLQTAYRVYTAKKWWWRKQLREIMEVNFAQSDIPTFDVFDSETSLAESILIKRNDDWKTRLEMIDRRRNAQFGRGTLSFSASRQEITRSKSKIGFTEAPPNTPVTPVSQPLTPRTPGPVTRSTSLGGDDDWDVNPHRTRRLHHATLKIWMMADPDPVNRKALPDRHNPVEDLPSSVRPAPYNPRHMQYARPIRRLFIRKSPVHDANIGEFGLVWSRVPRQTFNHAEMKQDKFGNEYTKRLKSVTARAAASKVQTKAETRSLRDLDARYGKRKATMHATATGAPKREPRSYRSRGMTLAAPPPRPTLTLPVQPSPAMV